jgi:S-adenosylmethionine:tRNA ribosyltransferase-isomerase
MLTKELNYDLPAELIAQQPAENRSESRLLVLERKTGSITDSRFSDIGRYLRRGDCLVLNDTKVLSARFYARRESGGKLEGLFLKQQDDGLWEAMLKGAGRVKLKEKIWLKSETGEDYCYAEVIDKTDEGKCVLRIEQESSAEEILERIGFAPVPPYIKRDAGLTQAGRDKERYQTVYAKKLGAVAAPTAGLHWTKELLEKLEESGIRVAYITLHVGEGTFKPVTTETLEEHRIHEEWFSIDARNAETINEAKKAGGRIVAVGTTSVRVLETICAGGQVRAGDGTTQLFILPGFRFGMVDAMITNFHLPRSTLLALVASFTGLETILSVYKHAVENRYRFYSYGDAMLII